MHQKLSKLINEKVKLCSAGSSQRRSAEIPGGSELPSLLCRLGGGTPPLPGSEFEVVHWTRFQQNQGLTPAVLTILGLSSRVVGVVPGDVGHLKWPTPRKHKGLEGSSSERDGGGLYTARASGA